MPRGKEQYWQHKFPLAPPVIASERRRPPGSPDSHSAALGLNTRGPAAHPPGPPLSLAAVFGAAAGTSSSLQCPRRARPSPHPDADEHVLAPGLDAHELCCYEHSLCVLLKIWLPSCSGQDGHFEVGPCPSVRPGTRRRPRGARSRSLPRGVCAVSLFPATMQFSDLG